MPSLTATQTSIANRALQLLGQQPISSLQENSRGARAMNRAYQPVLLSALRSAFWNFSIKRAQLAASATPPIFGYANAFPLPPDFLELAPPDNFSQFNVFTLQSNIGPAATVDYFVEGGQILSNQAGPLNIRYTSSAITEAAFDPLFCEAFSALLALETGEEITNSAQKVSQVQQFYKDTMDLARQRNAYEERPQHAPVSAWIQARW